MCILHNTISNRCQLDRKTAKTTNQSKDENRRHRIRNRISRRPTANRRRPHPHNRHRTNERHTPHRTPSTTAKGRNVQEPDTETLGRKLVQHTKRFRCCAQRTREERLPLRPNRSGACVGGFGQGKRAHENRQTTQVPVRAKETAALENPKSLIVLHYSIVVRWSR